MGKFNIRFYKPDILSSEVFISCWRDCAYVLSTISQAKINYICSILFVFIFDLSWDRVIHKYKKGFHGIPSFFLFLGEKFNVDMKTSY